MTTSPLKLAGRTIGIYTLETAFGDESAHGVLYKSINNQTNQHAAVKILRTPNDDERELFNREAAIHGSLKHPNIVEMQYYDYDKPYDVYYIGMDYIEGESLAARLENKGTALNVKEVANIFRQITGALQHVHARPTLHLDIKPGNIYLSQEDGEEKAWLIDFGLGVWLLEAHRNEKHPLHGTFPYRSPEQILNQTLGNQADLFSLGLVLYEMFTGVFPFEGADPTALERNVVNEPAPAPSEVQSTLPKSIDAFFIKALAKKIEDRYQSADDMFNGFLSQIPNDELAGIKVKIPRGRSLPPLHSLPVDDAGKSINLVYIEKGSGLPLIFLPPWVSNQGVQWTERNMARFLNSLSNDYRLITYDKRGCGLSERKVKDLSYDAQLNDLETLVGHLDLPPFAILAISAGGPLAISYATRNPNRVLKLIIYGSYVDGTKILNEEEKDAQISLTRAFWGRQEAGLFYAQRFAPAASAKMKDWLARYQKESSSREHAALFVSEIYKTNVTDEAQMVNCPTLILHRFSDRAIPYSQAEQLSSLIDGAKLCRLEGSDHVPWLGDQDIVLKEIRDFLS